ncbi:divalent-cation tolerance protein CutA [Patescibacteria group bacterium]|nr:divalent-cation tolerance protein CutA [Patescibacteria group bacterium]
MLLTTYPNKPRDLKKFILGLIKGNMAACVQRIQYVKSYYMREGKLEQAEEKILLIKLPDENKAKVQAYFAKNHPYDIPEMLRIKPEDVNEAYAQWVAKLIK